MAEKYPDEECDYKKQMADRNSGGVSPFEDLVEMMVEKLKIQNLKDKYSASETYNKGDLLGTSGCASGLLVEEPLKRQPEMSSVISQETGKAYKLKQNRQNVLEEKVTDEIKVAQVRCHPLSESNKRKGKTLYYSDVQISTEENGKFKVKDETSLKTTKKFSEDTKEKVNIYQTPCKQEPLECKLQSKGDSSKGKEDGSRNEPKNCAGECVKGRKYSEGKQDKEKQPFRRQQRRQSASRTSQGTSECKVQSKAEISSKEIADDAKQDFVKPKKSFGNFSPTSCADDHTREKKYSVGKQDREKPPFYRQQRRHSASQTSQGTSECKLQSKSDANPKEIADDAKHDSVKPKKSFDDFSPTNCADHHTREKKYSVGKQDRVKPPFYRQQRRHSASQTSHGTPECKLQSKNDANPKVDADDAQHNVGKPKQSFGINSPTNSTDECTRERKCSERKQDRKKGPFHRQERRHLASEHTLHGTSEDKEGKFPSSIVCENTKPMTETKMNTDDRLCDESEVLVIKHRVDPVSLKVIQEDHYKVKRDGNEPLLPVPLDFTPKQEVKTSNSEKQKTRKYNVEGDKVDKRKEIRNHRHPVDLIYVQKDLGHITGEEANREKHNGYRQQNRSQPKSEIMSRGTHDTKQQKTSNYESGRQSECNNTSKTNSFEKSQNEQDVKGKSDRIIPPTSEISSRLEKGVQRDKPGANVDYFHSNRSRQRQFEKRLNIEALPEGKVRQTNKNEVKAANRDGKVVGKDNDTQREQQCAQSGLAIGFNKYKENYEKKSNTDTSKSKSEDRGNTQKSAEETTQGINKSDTDKLKHCASRKSSRAGRGASKEAKKVSANVKNKGKAKETFVFVKFASAVSSETNVLGYLRNRLPRDIEFNLEDQVVDSRTKNTVCTLKCQGVRIASRLKHELHKGNANCETKLFCFDDKEDAFGTKIHRSQDIDKLLERHAKHIVNRAEQVLLEHDEKISDVRSQLAALQNGRSRRQKFLSLEEFQVKKIETQALSEKVDELTKQRKEFQDYLKSVHNKLLEIKDSKRFDRSAQEVRLAFAIECARLTNALPIYARRSDIIGTVNENQVCVIIGETGSGKSTQMAQYLYQTGLANDGLIACTQPRKIAATSLATHVAKEMGTSVGQLVGYKVGMQSRKTDLTKIMYMTDHVLLNECLKDKKLSAFSCIIIDEAHERSIYTDLLLGMIKECLTDRPDLRVIITSATIDPEVFVRYFGKCPILSVSGRAFPVDVEWKEFNPELDPFSNYEYEAVKKAAQVHCTEPDGDMLVFLTSPLETERCCEKFQDFLEGRQNDYTCFQLHGKLQPDEQQKVFDPLPKGKRKIVFATNSAETSVTIPGIKYVIDTGVVKEMLFDVNRKINTLAVKEVTQSSAEQRKGRAGRTGPGKCFRLYTEDDYKQMQPNSVPEIMKVHIGHAMLKLMELNIDPMEFDFVISPSVESIEAAILSLEDIGAVAEKKITDLGKWIAKLPLDPKYSAFVKHAIDNGVGLEAVVIAAICGVSSIFYRAGSAEQKDIADKRKVKFCDLGGDHLTMLNVYKEWHKVSEKQKGKWCFENSVNGKAIKSARETVNEVLHVLRKEMKTEIRFEFAKGENVDECLKSLLLRALKDNLSCYLGHPKAGYHFLNKDQRVEIHPSSALMSVGSHPEWVVFDQVMRTSKDFAMNVTPLSENDVLRGMESGWLRVDIDEAKSKRVVTVCSHFCGSQMFREFVGPRYSNLKQFEIDVAKKGPCSITIVDANRDTSELKIFSSAVNKPFFEHDLEHALKPIREKFQLEESEERVGSTAIDESVRAIIGAGGLTQTLYMPEEYRMVKIFCAINLVTELTKEDAEKMFSCYGEIQECKRYNLKQRSSLWGHIVYLKTESAVKAVKQTKGNPDISAKPNVKRSPQTEGFRTKIQWCRRPSRCFGFVEFTDVDDTLRAIMSQSFLVGGSLARVKLAKNSENTIHISGFNSLVNEDVLRQSVADKLDIDPVADIARVNVIREKVVTNAEHFATCKRRLLRKIEEYAKLGTFHLELLQPREWDINFTGFCNFEDPEEGHMACIEINAGFLLNGERVSMKANLHCSVYIHKRVFDKSGDEVETCIRRIENENKAVKPKWKRLKNDNVIVDLHAENAEALAEARGAIQDIIRGEVIECEDIQLARNLFCRNGRTKMQKIMDRTETLILMDDRSMTISIHGMARGRQIARKQINDYLLELTQENVREVELKGNGKPPGVMKALLQQFRIDLDGIRTRANLAAVRLDLRSHRLRLIGSDDAIAEAVTLVNGVMETLSSGPIMTEQDSPECVICFTPIETNQIYRLECCGHAYCSDCIQLQLDSNITSKEFPLKCGMEDCEVLFSWKDLLNLSRIGSLALARLTASSVSAFVSQHKKEFHYCITPDCPVVYRKSDTGVPFLCPECNMKICTSCDIQYHDGLTCAMYRSMKDDDGSLHVWMRKNRENRKLCPNPNCATPIEKTGGCQHMTCAGCRKHICWVCLKFFNSSGDCYGHLENVHGSFA